MNCLLVINTMSGNAAKVDPAEVIRRYAADDLERKKFYNNFIQRDCVLCKTSPKAVHTALDV